MYSKTLTNTGLQAFGLMEYVDLKEANSPWTKNLILNILHFSLYVFFIYI